MNYNICIIKPQGYLHSAAFTELAELVGYGLKDLGHAVELNVNKTYHDATNIIIGCHLLDPSMIEQMPESSIVINTEQIYDDHVEWNSNIFRWVSSFETWDYSERNLTRLQEIGAKNPKLLRLGFHPKLARIGKAETQDIDVLFYGSINDRRQGVLDALKEAGCQVHAVFGVYGDERDLLIKRSKVVINIHHYNSQIFEIVRVFYLMRNSKAVVSEVGVNTSIDAAYIDGIAPSPYDRLVEECMCLVRDDHRRIELERMALQTMMRLPQRDLLAPLF